MILVYKVVTIIFYKHMSHPCDDLIFAHSKSLSHPNPENSNSLSSQEDPNSLSLIITNSRHNHVPTNTFHSPTHILTEKENVESMNLSQEVTNDQKEKPLIQYSSMFLLDITSTRQKESHRVFMTVVLENSKRAAIEVLNFKRCLYFVLNPAANEQDAKSEIGDLLRSHGILNSEITLTGMKYIFEIEGIPRGDVRVCEVRYPFGIQSQMPSPATKGYTFTYIIGTTYTPMELFVIRNQIKGPQWLRVPKKLLEAKEEVSKSNIIEFSLTEPECIDAETLRGRAVPPLRVLSLSLKAGKPFEMGIQLKKAKDRLKNEFVIYNLCYAFNQNYELNGKDQDLPTESQSFFLSEFGKPKADQNAGTKFKPMQDENLMLSYLMTRISVLDPDVIVCHDSSCTIDLVTSKLGFYQNDNLKKLGRFYLGNYISGNTNASKRTSALMKGRIFVDMMKHAEEAIKTGDRKLSTLSAILNLKPVPQLTYNDTVKMVKSCQFSSLLVHTHQQTLNTLNILSQLKMLQSSLQLANICGYIWQKVLHQNRAQRNEYLIMHECFKQRYLIPDKFFFQDEGYDGRYEGGMVLDPKRGLHNGFVVLLDFISLYPSIIREYNVCFSKINRNLLPMSHYVKVSKKEVEKVKQEVVVVPPEMEFCTQENWGLLPKLIHLLVSEREKYKNLMKSATTPAEKSNYNIVQTAYKLVANSIYGCLGYEKSRFYAKDLASLITRLGRQSLENAQDIIENWRQDGRKSFEVIYGDTDSLMLKTNLQSDDQQNVRTELEKVLDACNGVAADINSFYNVIKMQIDGVFHSILLVAKKKYAGRKLCNLGQLLSPLTKNTAQPEFTIEYKGVETIRNDSSVLLKQVTSQLFEILLQPSKNATLVASEIYQYFEYLSQTISADTRNDYNKFVIRKVLNKDPNSYIKDKGMHHVLVAKDLISQGHSVDSLINHMIQYVLVAGEKGQAKAVDVNAFVKAKGKENEMMINEKYYKENEILPVVERMMEAVEQVDMGLLKEKFLGKIAKRKEDGNVMKEEIIEDRNHEMEKVDMKIQEVFGFVSCNHCSKNNRITKNGILVTCCQYPECLHSKESSLLAPVINKIFMDIASFIREYYSPIRKCKNCEKQWGCWVRKCLCQSRQFYAYHSQHSLHQNFYLVRRVVVATIDKHPETHPGLSPLLNHIDQTLQSSSFQLIPSTFFQKLKFKP